MYLHRYVGIDAYYLNTHLVIYSHICIPFIYSHIYTPIYVFVYDRVIGCFVGEARIQNLGSMGP